MAVSTLEKRMGTLETKLAHLRLNKECSCRSGQQINGTADSLCQLEELTHEADRIKQQAEAEGEFRTALAAISLMCRMVELAAKMRGEFDESRQTNVNIDSDTATRMAETYLARHRKLESK